MPKQKFYVGDKVVCSKRASGIWKFSGEDIIECLRHGDSDGITYWLKGNGLAYRANELELVKISKIEIT